MDIYKPTEDEVISFRFGDRVLEFRRDTKWTLGTRVVEIPSDFDPFRALGYDRRLLCSGLGSMIRFNNPKCPWFSTETDGPIDWKPRSRWEVWVDDSTGYNRFAMVTREIPISNGRDTDTNSYAGFVTYDEICGLCSNLVLESES